MISDRQPNENAIVVRCGRRRLLASAPAFLPACGAGVVGIGAVVTGSPIGFVFAALGSAGVWQFLRAWRQRRQAIAFDSAGLWRLSPAHAELIPWDALNSVGICDQKGLYPLSGNRGRVFVLELWLQDGGHEIIDIRLCRSLTERALWRFAPSELLFGEETRT